MPPKIASLVKFFEEQQQSSSTSSTPERSFTRAQSYSPSARSVSISNSASPIPIPPPAIAQRRRVSAPVESSSSTPSRAHRETGRLDNNVVALPHAGRDSTAQSIDVTGEEHTTRTENPVESTRFAAGQPLIVKDKASPAEPLESKDSATNIEGKKAKQLIIDKLIATSTPTKNETSSSKAPNSARPLPIKERFKQRHHLLATTNTSSNSQVTAGLSSTSKNPLDNVAREEREVTSVRKVSLPVYPGRSPMNGCPYTKVIQAKYS
ncbi:hypothetical protein P389DRAFT_171405 [Cystobasidium minutum MCA 4210]|uniref:uncharacterized protein n=1 Tax=Cystobasidium minutum MCA 4210 TaxID=1397322 RepID=UPI0034CE09FA|eukprot:jgi/Rhomi1/171405/fgenesh1_kg.4_\